MKIISNFKDYYDYATFLTHDNDYKDTVYLRKTDVKIVSIGEKRLTTTWITYRKNTSGDYFKSKWWEENKLRFALPDVPSGLNAGCLFVCGKPYPFLYLRSYAEIGSEGKGGQIKISKHFNNTIKNADNCVANRYESRFNFFKTYFSFNDFFEDNTFIPYDTYICKNKIYKSYQSHAEQLERHERELKRYFDFYANKDFTELHLHLDCPIFLTLFYQALNRKNTAQYNYEFILNPNLNELDFVKIMSGEILTQELDMFLGNVLVKDVMPPSYQSDIDKLTSHGFDPKTSFRNSK